MTFCGGTGASLDDPLHSAVYTLDEGSLAGVDADYGAFWQNSYYSTYFFIGQEEAQQQQLGVHRLLHGFASMNITGIGAVYLLPSLDRIGNFGRQTRAVNVTEDLARDLEFGLNLTAERISYRIGVQPQGMQPFDPAAQAGFKLSSMTVSVKTDPYAPIRGWNG